MAVLGHHRRLQSRTFSSCNPSKRELFLPVLEIVSGSTEVLLDLNDFLVVKLLGVELDAVGRASLAARIRARTSSLVKLV